LEAPSGHKLKNKKKKRKKKKAYRFERDLLCNGDNHYNGNHSMGADNQLAGHQVIKIIYKTPQN